MEINIQEIIHSVPVLKSLFIILQINWGQEVRKEGHGVHR